jgi:hypothetical protein
MYKAELYNVQAGQSLQEKTEAAGSMHYTDDKYIQL